MPITILSMNSTAKGSAKERQTSRLLAEGGWLVASRRHIGGAADLLAVHPDRRPLLIEVKASKRGPYQDFPPADREALRAEAERYGCSAYLAWWKPRARTHKLIPASGWPS